MYFPGLKSPKNLRGLPPGNITIGLDRAPELSRFRIKLFEIASLNNANDWLNRLSIDWVQENSNTLYIDGHVNVYAGKLADLPKKQKICQKGKTGLLGK